MTSDPRQLPELIRMMVDAAVDAAAIVDPELRLLYYNLAYVRLAGLSVREFRRRRWLGMCHTHFRLESCVGEGCVARRATRSKRALRVDEVESQLDGKRLIVTAVPILDG